MVTYSQTDLATRMLRDLGLIGAEEVPSASDLAWAKETVSCETGTLASLGMPIWNGSDMAVPPEYMTPLSRRIGLAIAPSYGLSDMASAVAGMRATETTLAILANPRPAGSLLMQTDEATGSRRRFNYTTGR